MTDFLPLFPLKMVVYPGENVNLHIFEPRYKQLIRECEQNLVTFGIPTFIGEKVMPIGTEIRLLSIEKKHPDGKLDIKTKGVGIFKIKEFYSQAPNKLYPGADITRLSLDDTYDEGLNEEILEQLKMLFELLDLKKKLPRSGKTYRMFDVAHFIGLDINQEYALLTLPTELERQEFTLQHLKKLIPVVKNMEKSRELAKLNGHFRNVIPPDV